ncbi:MAG: hypothetical protein R2753_07755 [Chitinophagales bacterium]
MGKFYLLIFISTCLIFSNGYSQSTGLRRIDQGFDSKDEMYFKVLDFTNQTNGYLKQKVSKSTFDQFMMTEEDLRYWADQFVFTEEVLQQMSREEFYNKIESWAIEAKMNFDYGLKNIESVLMADSKINISPDPNMRVSKSANVKIHLLQNGNVIRIMNLTLIDVKGQLKLIQAN